MVDDEEIPCSIAAGGPVSRRVPRHGHPAARARTVAPPRRHPSRKRAVARATLGIAKAVGLVRPLRKKPLPTDPVLSAKAANCRYVDDSGPGITRAKAGKGWKYLTPHGKLIRDREVVARINSLAIPPAWTKVWICPDVSGHIQATGRDVRGRKQYRYHPRFREVREETKYERMMQFAETLPVIRAKVDEDLSLPGLTRNRVLATVVRLLEITLIRVGNEEYARDNGSFGLTTMRTRHVDITTSSIKFRFRGKSGKEHAVKVQDRRLARVVARCNDLPGEVLFQYLDDDGTRHSVESSDVNEYIRSITGAELTAKDFRTWAGTVLAAEALRELAAHGAKATKKDIVAAVKDVSRRLGNTPTVCRKCYVHPQIFDAYLDGHLATALQPSAEQELGENLPALSSAEAAVLLLLRDRLAGKRPVPPTEVDEAPPHSRAA